jgi:hypothetical protein
LTCPPGDSTFEQQLFYVTRPASLLTSRDIDESEEGLSDHAGNDKTFIDNTHKLGKNLRDSVADRGDDPSKADSDALASPSNEIRSYLDEIQIMNEKIREIKEVG